MLEVYHYTTAYGIGQIIRSGYLKKSRILGKTADSENELAISLTFDPSPVGHGLPDGSMLTHEEAELIPHEMVDGKPHSFNHMDVRIVIDFSMIKHSCVTASSFHSSDDFWQMQATAYYPNRHPMLLTAEDVNRQLVRISKGLDRAKGSSWIYSFEDIPVVFFHAIDIWSNQCQPPKYKRFAIEAAIQHYMTM